MLDAIAGYDPNDPVTARSAGHIPSSCTSFLRSDGLKGKRIGVLRGLFTPASTNVNAVIDQALIIGPFMWDAFMKNTGMVDYFRCTEVLTV